MKSILIAVVVSLLVFWAQIARADSIAIGQLSYLGTTITGESVFKITLNPPAGIALTSLVPSIYIGNDKLTFSLPTSSSEFLFITGPGTAFDNCPCTDAHLDFYASPGTTVTLGGDTLTLKRLSHSFLLPETGEKYLLPRQSATIYLSTIPGQSQGAVRVAAVPEPGSFLLAASGFGVIVLKKRRRPLTPNRLS